MSDLPITSDEGATPIVINDPTTTANVANVKAASTAAGTGDSSLVVALSPNSPIPTGTNKIGVTGVSQGSTTSGENGDLVQGAVTTANPSYSTGQTSPLSLDTSGNLRVTVTGSGGGTETVIGNKTNNNAVPGATNLGVLPAIANAASPSWTEGDQVLESVDLSGNLRTINTPGDPVKATYALSSTLISPPTSPTDIYILNGSATKTIRILKVEITATQTTAGTITVVLVKRSSANSGGTFTTVNAIPYDSNDPSPSSATVLEYSVNPSSLGTAVSFIRTAKIFVPAPATTSAGTFAIWNFGESFGKPIILRGTAQGLAVNLNATTVSGGSFLVTMEWTEE